MSESLPDHQPNKENLYEAASPDDIKTVYDETKAAIGLVADPEDIIDPSPMVEVDGVQVPLKEEQPYTEISSTDGFSIWLHAPRAAEDLGLDQSSEVTLGFSGECALADQLGEYEYYPNTISVTVVKSIEGSPDGMIEDYYTLELDSRAGELPSGYAETLMTTRLESDKQVFTNKEAVKALMQMMSPSEPLDKTTGELMMEHGNLTEEEARRVKSEGAVDITNQQLAALRAMLPILTQQGGARHAA